ncbi:hypothetical protein SAMN05421788_101596 [Filimonas lacunae]|uniref:Uncharacterized protein n=1 Tax=Filimonas lacunae TaxID=477680 RepID=A0A173MNE0_9BACT|nr:hypothetical protein [Filimonas lacunae]BAV09154.1 hypothetical protein FLA_5202 [Filimonas lacunae]SIS68080.1 hypothetical protein SAMN05421788_101596 [Filimonas lacunae]
MAEEKQLTQQESLELITKMLQTAKGHFHSKGTSAILWGSVIGVCGIVSFLQRVLHISTGYNIWQLVFIAIIPQIIISIREAKNRKVITVQETFLNVIWSVYGISLAALIFYLAVVPGVTTHLMAEEGKALFIRNSATAPVEPLEPFIYSQSSLYLILYSIPTLATGWALKFRPMVIGGILCYVFFIISCYTSSTYDFLLNGLSGIFCWLIPGLILRKRYNCQRGANV